VLDSKDRAGVEAALFTPGQGAAPAAGTIWAPSGIFADMSANQKALENKIAQEAEATRAANAAQAAAVSRANANAALRTQRMGNLNTMMGMLGQAPDTKGQQVTVKAADPAKIGYVYDFGSMFANPQQEKMFASPYAKGGMVNDVDAVNDELLKILKG
jgi:hypothetical protein